MKKQVLNGSIVVTDENVCSIVQDNYHDIINTKKQVMDNKEDISRISNRLWLIIVLLASTLRTSGANLLMGMMK